MKVVPALLAGNSVLRPSPLTPLSSLVFAEAAEAVGLPAGVLNVVLERVGRGRAVLTTDPAVDQGLASSAPPAVGRRILAQAAPGEAGVARAGAASAGRPRSTSTTPSARVSMRACRSRRCIAAARRRPVAATHAGPERAQGRGPRTVAATYATITVGDPNEPGTLMGLAHRPRRPGALRALRGAGRGARRQGGLRRRPTGPPRAGLLLRAQRSFDVPDNANPAAQDEIFGPVLSVIGYDDVDGTVRIANDSPYGLSAQVYGADVAAATAIARRIRAGAVNVNTSCSAPTRRRRLQAERPGAWRGGRGHPRVPRGQAPGDRRAEVTDSRTSTGSSRSTTTSSSRPTSGSTVAAKDATGPRMEVVNGVELSLRRQALPGLQA